MTTYGPWKRTPAFLTLFGAPRRRRRRYASWMIGGGFDGWNYDQLYQAVHNAAVQVTGDQVTAHEIAERVCKSDGVAQNTFADLKS